MNYPCIGSFQKRSTLPPRRKFLPSGGETKLFQIIVNVLGHPKGVRGLTSNFLRGGGMDVFWNDPFIKALSRLSLHYSFDTLIRCHFVSFLTCISCFYIYLVKYFNLNEKLILLKNSSDRIGIL
jgi:hypothetical protein